ncbi:transposase, partial [Pseudomonas aeruginosa]|nr:transposase [Pseudomonas aeruginosa]
GLLGEFGLIATRRGRAATMALLETVMATEPASLPAPMGELLRELKDELQTLEARIARLERQIQAHVRGDARIQRLLAVEGIGPISASAVAASAGDARQFRTGRQFAAWL